MVWIQRKEMMMRQLVLDIAPEMSEVDAPYHDRPCRDRLAVLLAGDLDFHEQGSRYASHNFHSFPAKFPPQLPAKFIAALTAPGDRVLDPMSGSGTTVLEAYLAGRQAIGFDIDPLALLISTVKVTPLDLDRLTALCNLVLRGATLALRNERATLADSLAIRWDAKTHEFMDYWFASETQLELVALLTEIEKIADVPIRAFFVLAFSAIIITKSGGVSLALDLGHTRPHRAKFVAKPGQGWPEGEAPPTVQTKILRPALEEFQKRFQQNLRGISALGVGSRPAAIALGNAQQMPLSDDCVDLIVTSPPYASNAIDYMRAHKFSLAWLGYPIQELGQRREDYIGGEMVSSFEFEELPDGTARLVAEIACLDARKGRVLHRYYSEMTRTLREMHRVLRPGRAAIVVVGSSIMRGRDTETQNCLAEIGRAIGFEVPGIGVRRLDRDRRMMPAGFKLDLGSQIQQRMHEEYVIGYYKPER
jgi:SAM-dependent methyltransferase